MVDKKVDSPQELSQTQAEVLHALSKGLNITEIAKYRKTSRQAVFKVILKLLKKGFIEKIGQAYGLTEKGRQGLHSFIGFTYKKRFHNLAIKIAVLESPRNWDQKRSHLIQLPYFNKRVELKNNEYDLFNFGKVQVKTTTKSVIVKLPTVYSETVEEAVVEAMDIFFSTIPKIEAQFKIKLIKDRKANMTLISQEFARLNDALARLYSAEGNKLYIRDENGDIWLIADYSFATNELETISPKRADEDMTIVDGFMNDLRKNPMKLSDLKEILQIQTSNIQGITQNQGVFDKNMVSHLEVIKEMAVSQRELAQTVRELREEIKKIGERK